MSRFKKALPQILMSSGMLGLGLYGVGNHYKLSVMPTTDIGKGLWFGICLGISIVGIQVLKRQKRVCQPSR